MLVNEFVSLTAIDRCDRCGAQAVAQAERRNGKPLLLFCGHCTRRFQDSILNQGYIIRWDETKDYY